MLRGDVKYTFLLLFPDDDLDAFVLACAYDRTWCAKGRWRVGRLDSTGMACHMDESEREVDGVNQRVVVPVMMLEAGAEANLVAINQAGMVSRAADCSRVWSISFDDEGVGGGCSTRLRV